MLIDIKPPIEIFPIIFPIDVHLLPPKGIATPDPDPGPGTTTVAGPVTPSGGHPTDSVPRLAAHRVASTPSPSEARSILATVGPVDLPATPAAAPNVPDTFGTAPQPASPPATPGKVALVPPPSAPTVFSPPARFEEPDSQTLSPLDPVTGDGSTPADRQAVQASDAPDNSSATISRAADTGTGDDGPDLGPLDPQHRSGADYS